MFLILPGLEAEVEAEHQVERLAGAFRIAAALVLRADDSGAAFEFAARVRVQPVVFGAIEGPAGGEKERGPPLG